MITPKWNFVKVNPAYHIHSLPLSHTHSFLFFNLFWRIFFVKTFFISFVRSFVRSFFLSFFKFNHSHNRHRRRHHFLLIFLHHFIHSVLHFYYHYYYWLHVKRIIITGCTRIACKVDCTQERHLFLSTKHHYMTCGFSYGISVVWMFCTYK